MPGSLGSHFHCLREVEAEHLRRQHSGVVDSISGQTEQLEDARLRLSCPPRRPVGPCGVLKKLQISLGFYSSTCLTKSPGLDRVQGWNFLRLLLHWKHACCFIFCNFLEASTPPRPLPKNPRGLFYIEKAGSSLTDLSIFELPAQLQCVFSCQLEYVCVCFVTWVFSCSGACVGPDPALVVLAKPESFSTASAVHFHKRRLINTMRRSVNPPHVRELCSGPGCVRACVAPRSSRRLQNQRRLLNSICTKTTGLCTRRAPLPASRRVGQPPDAACSSAAPPVCSPPVFVRVFRIFSR